MKKPPGDIITLHMCTINDNHMMYGSWNMERDRQFFVILDRLHITDMAHNRCHCYFSFWAIFLPFYLCNSPKNQNLQKMKKTPGDIIILHNCTKNHYHILYCSWDMIRDRCNCYFSFWAIFCPLTPLTAQNIKIFKKWKKHLEKLSFYICVPKSMIRWCTVPEIWCVMDGWTDGRKDERKKWHVEVGAPRKNSSPLPASPL